jgi:galactose-1-phosphate uridylyltransferase
MAKLILDHNPLSGESVFFEFDNHTDEVRITHEQDVSKFMDIAHEIAVDDNATAEGIKNDMWRYAKVPNHVLMEMMTKHGVNVFDRNDDARFFDLLNTEYKRFKTTTKTHRVRRGR